MSNVIVPEITPDVETLKDTLVRQLPAGCKISIPPLNRKCLRIVKSLGIVSEVHLRPSKIVVHNATPMYAALATLFCLPFGIYLITRMKDGEALRSSIHNIVKSAVTRQ